VEDPLDAAVETKGEALPVPSTSSLPTDDAADPLASTAALDGGDATAAATTDAVPAVTLRPAPADPSAAEPPNTDRSSRSNDSASSYTSSGSSTSGSSYTSGSSSGSGSFSGSSGTGSSYTSSSYSTSSSGSSSSSGSGSDTGSDDDETKEGGGAGGVRKATFLGRLSQAMAAKNEEEEALALSMEYIKIDLKCATIDDVQKAMKTWDTETGHVGCCKTIRVDNHTQRLKHERELKELRVQLEVHAEAVRKAEADK
jgi:hypothetical protein